MQIVVNGERRQVPEGTTVAALLTALSIEPRRVAVELNERVVPKARHAETTLGEADRLEIVTFVGGG
ncbi:MAG: sulfur carrier protein ThiS [Myxococcaceae bacterium]|jgi:thiamine biosynthesis protein ThiS|nr:sulfur carrier protein ThiS [Myxococcaceae bacterium]MCA3014587.1 sulfur carrier protein ThiS [Myxococcaceae bacterium]